MKREIIILAGGIGSRLWPISTKNNPKQFSSLFGSKSLIQHAFERAINANANSITVVTSKDMGKKVVEHARMINGVSKKLTVIEEPEGKNTAPALLSALLYLKSQSFENSEVLVMASDHLIPDKALFNSDLDLASKTLQKQTKPGNNSPIILFGINPSSPNTGYGYIEAKSKIDNKNNLMKVDNFKEKPSLEIAVQYFQSGNFLWNSGMFFFSRDNMVKKFKKLMPDLYSLFRPIKNRKFFNTKKIILTSKNDIFANLYKNCEKTPIDKGIIEKTDNAVVIKASFRWSDAGTWKESVPILKSKNRDHTVKEIEGENNFAYTKKPVTFCGTSNLIVIESDTDILVSDIEKSELIKQ